MKPSSAIDIIRSSQDYYSRLFDDIRKARSSVLIQMYIVDEDNIGLEFSSLLIKKVEEGLAVDLIYDSVGSISTPSHFFDKMAAAGVRVMEYNPINPGKRPGPFSFRAMMRRNHRKLAVIDGSIYYLGGMNIGERFLGWEDITIRGEGNVATVLQASFDNIGRRGFARPKGPKFKELETKRIQVCDSRPAFQNYPIKKMHLGAINRARKRVWIAQAYFIPRRKIVKALIQAVGRGVDVRVMVPDRSDVLIADLAAWIPLRRLMKHGVRVMRFTGEMLHSKITIIDDGFVTTGTANLDSMSFYWNLEINLVIRDTDVVSRFSRIYEDYETKSRVVDDLEPEQRSWIVRMIGAALYHYSWIL
ncbi:MAG: phospholipase D-like domain-containing protein [Nitrospinota bacterium]|nr:phospholipase D-like domain-containing protein [Nitrospinota bacterium]MDH5755147.1 phospholipase D-like domain-containing protein [Nitrospinota bacterium]